MTITKTTTVPIATLALAVSLTACGGASSPPEPEPDPFDAEAEIAVDDVVVVPALEEYGTNPQVGEIDDTGAEVRLDIDSFDMLEVALNQNWDGDGPGSTAKQCWGFHQIDFGDSGIILSRVRAEGSSSGDMLNARLRGDIDEAGDAALIADCITHIDGMFGNVYNPMDEIEAAEGQPVKYFELHVPFDQVTGIAG